MRSNGDIVPLPRELVPGLGPMLEYTLRLNVPLVSADWRPRLWWLGCPRIPFQYGANDSIRFRYDMSSRPWQGQLLSKM
jgi:hypothetical protein